MEPDAHDVATCLRVLGAVPESPDDPRFAEVRNAINVAYRALKKARRGERRARQNEQDQALLAAASRHRDEIPSTVPSITAIPADGHLDSSRDDSDKRPTLHRHRQCYVCKRPYRVVDADYHMHCPDCAAIDATRRHARADLRGRRVVITGGRVKIGFHTTLKLLRDGADVIVTTRFPRDAARRFAAVPDAADWTDRLSVCGVDFLDLPSVVGLVEHVTSVWDGLDILINNAAQTVRRPPQYHREVRAAEAEPLRGIAAAIAVTRTDRSALPAGASSRDVLDAMLPATVESLFPAGRTDETGQPLDLRSVNSWTIGVEDVTPQEWLETHVINAFVPFLLTGKLRPLLRSSAHPDRYIVQVSAMEGSFSRRYKTSDHPHTNMAKAALNMLTRTVAADYVTDGIHMTSVDTGWVTDERPHPEKLHQRGAGFRPPLDVIDGAARVYDPIVRGVGGERLSGVFLKDYRPVDW